MKLQLSSILSLSITLFILIVIIYLSVYTRLSTLTSPLVLDYDPWWYYRHAVEILNNNFQVPKWDLLSFYPPGRPPEAYQGLEYAIIIFFKIISLFRNISIMEAAKLTPVILVGLASIPAFLLGKLLSNKWGGLATALFATLTPTFIGVSMGGYSDADAAVVFYFFFSVYSILLALTKRKFYFYIFAILANLAFVYTWGGGWLPQIFFVFSLPAFFIFRMLEDIIHEKKLKFDINKIFAETKPLVIPLLIILIVTNIIGSFFGLGNVILSLLIGFGFTGLAGALVLITFTFVVSFFGFIAGYSFYNKIGGVIGSVIGFMLIVFTLLFGGVSLQPLLVNVSVAELQRISIFTREGFLTVVGRIGLAPTLFTLFGLPLLVLFKIYKKIRIDFAEIFMFAFALVTFYLILQGVRFALLFSIAAAVSAGYVIGNMFVYFKKDVIGATAFGFTLLLVVMFVSDAIQIGYASAGMEISQNWVDAMDWLKKNADKDSLIVTWWDPGHIIAGYTGLKVHADGAHCPPGVCIPYDHNIRIQDMGFVFSTSDEEKAITTLKKYMSLTPQQCQEVKKAFGNIVPNDACKPVTEMYVIASSDLIGKYHWLSYFGQQGNARDFIQLPLTGYDPNQDMLSYYNGLIYLVRKENQWVPVYQNRYVIKEIVYYEDGALKQLNFTNMTDSVDGLLWVDPSYQVVIFMLPEVRESIFTRLFFWNGQGLKSFELKYSNPEIRIYRVIF